MKKKKWHILALFLGIGVVVVLFVGIQQWMLLHTAHSSFANYASFRGCVRTISVSATSGTCQTAKGAIVHIVSFHNKWYLKGDLPVCFGKFCF